MVTVVVVGVLVDVVSEFCMRLDVVSEFCTHFESTVTQPTDTREAVLAYTTNPTRGLSAVNFVV